MSALEKFKDWICTFDGFPDNVQVDFTDKVPSSSGVFPAGISELGRKKDILGGVILYDQYNFGIYWVFCKSPGDDEEAEFNAGWVMDFQSWVQEQSALGLAPKFDNTMTYKEVIVASDGQLYDADEEGTAMYMVQVVVRFYKELTNA